MAVTGREYARCCWSTLHQRFGDREEVKRRLAQYLLAQKHGPKLTGPLTTEEIRRLMSVPPADTAGDATGPDARRGGADGPGSLCGCPSVSAVE